MRVSHYALALFLSAPALGAENLDRNTPRDTFHELAMTAGRLNKVPVSGAWYGQFTHTTGTLVGYRVDVRVQCVAGSLAAADECDPGLLVVATNASGQVLNVAFNNDHPAAAGNQLGSFVSLSQGRSQTVTYKVVVYSHHRGTSRVNIQWAPALGQVASDWNVQRAFADPLNPGLTMPALNRVVGATLVELGPVNPTDHFNVRTVDDGATAGTRLWLFNPTQRAFAFTDGPTIGDRDPDFAFSNAWTCEAACVSQGLTSDNFAIVGKDDLASGPEVWVDLVKSISANDTFVSFPFGLCEGGSHRPDCIGSDTTLGPGVYFFSVFVGTSFPVGAVPAIDGRAHPGRETGNPRCIDLPALASMDRGQGNDLALILDLVEDGRVVRTRYVPRGALGAGEGLNRLTLEHTVPDDGKQHAYRINLRRVGPMVLADSRWSYRRNPESVELKVASLNVEYGGDMQLQGEMQNAADLLGAGPNYLGSEVVYRANRGQWRWEADILNFNEILPGRGAWMQDRLNARTAFSWQRSEGQSIWPHNTAGAGDSRYGPVLLSPFAQKGSGGASFGAVLDQLLGCESLFNHCQVVVANDAPVFAERVYYTVPARAAVRRMKVSTGGFLDRPIAVFHAYLPSGNLEIRERDEGTTNLVRRMKDLLAAQPGAFNASGSPDPRDRGNRMIVLGDVNMANNQCSEVNAMVRKLREAFGYALDVSMAIVGPDLRTFDMHYSGGLITDPRTGAYGDCQALNWAGDWGRGEAFGCPFHYRPASSWEAEGRPRNTGPEQHFSWWAGPSSGQGGGGSRLDVILLVGLGWADDDPVREYLALANTESPNLANGFQRAGVEIRRYCEPDPQFLTLGHPPNYHPENPVCGGIPAQPGALAFRSDHKPVGARLRVQFYR